MTADSQDLKPLLLETDEEFRQLATKHHELEERLHVLTNKHYLSDPEQVEEITLKKRKLQLKDRMEAIVRRYRDRPSPPLQSPSLQQG
ncbi:MAG TPA: YdcH family protein [Vicinamibacterales bacterium]|nr:YdcH family protein [Vicinamibacterales bacterium]